MPPTPTCADPPLSASVFYVARKASTLRSLRCSARSVLKLERRGARREPDFGCGRQPRCAALLRACRGYGTIPHFGFII
jgi:hypothetical protein